VGLGLLKEKYIRYQRGVVPDPQKLTSLVQDLSAVSLLQLPHAAFCRGGGRWRPYGFDEHAG